MEFQANLIMYMEIIGSIAFSISGAMVGIRLGMDMFGVIVLGCCTACGGGMCRDVILGRFPAFMQNPRYLWIAALTALITFMVVYLNRHHLLGLSYRGKKRMDFILNLTDAIGLGAFTVVGIMVCEQLGYKGDYFVLIFMGVLTACGGGLLRDTMAGVKPYIFTKHIYAIASILGGMMFIVICEMGYEFRAVVISCIFMVALRLLAARYRWSLPKLK